MRHLASSILVGLLGFGASASHADPPPDFITFETGQVRPLALSPDKSKLFALNTPDGYLEIFDTTSGSLARAGSVPVGLEPIAVAARTNDEVWVVNHLSDSVSIIDVSSRRVKRTLLVGDEPRDIVFAKGPGGVDRAFVTTAHRGQQRTHPSIASVPGAGDPRLTTPGVPRADVWVFDADDLDGGGARQTLGGRPVEIIELFGDTPRALAASPDGARVYAAVFHSGNRTTTIAEDHVCDQQIPGLPTNLIPSVAGLPCITLAGVMPGPLPVPRQNREAKKAPEVGLIVKFDAATGRWQDELGRDWSAAVRFSLPDKDVFEIDAATLQETKSFSGVGTVLFDMVVAPDGKVFVSNSEARNEVRFEGPGILASDPATPGFKPSGDPSTVQGHLHEMRITVLEGRDVRPRRLNKHIDYSVRPAPAGTKDHSLSIPVDMVISSDGKLYVAAFGSRKIGVFDAGALAGDTFNPITDSAAYIPLCAGNPTDPTCGGGPSGLALDEAKDRLYVLTRFDNSVRMIARSTGSELDVATLHNPEPPRVVNGRPFLYDAQATSSNGEASCASCHVFGDFDSLAWDLGNPDGDMTDNPIPIRLENGTSALAFAINGTGEIRKFHPMKGPMTTQTLRGMVNHGAMHWRGDRVNPSDPFDSAVAFKKFIVAFEGLLGNEAPISDPDMQKFADFILTVTLPPNPVRALDDSLGAEQQAGREFFFGKPQFGGPRRADGAPFFADVGFTCEGCHRLDPAQGFFGTDGRASFELETQIVKIAHLRNVYQKVGMFGMPPGVQFLPRLESFFHQGDQVRGFGLQHDGVVDSVFSFTHALVFENTGFAGFENDEQRRQVEQFILAFDSDLAPIVGQQVTLSATSGADVHGRIDLLETRAGAGFVSKILGGQATECDLVVKGTFGGQERAWLYEPVTALFVGDNRNPISDEALRACASTPGHELTYTCVPPGSGARVRIPRGAPPATDACPTS